MVARAHVFIIVGSAVLALALIAARPRMPNVRRTVASVAVVALVTAFTLALTVHACDAGQPLKQWLVPNAAALAVLLFVAPRHVTSGIAAILMIAAFVLSMHFSALVHGGRYIGNPGWAADLDEPQLIVESAWHTPITGLYELRSR